MISIQDITNKYGKRLDYFDLEIIIANSLNKTREFVLSHPEQVLTKKKLDLIEKLIQRRIQGEPIAHIFGHKEFFGLDFIVNKHTLVPRPETELMVEKTLSSITSTSKQKHRPSEKITIIDVGTGSGCIIISIANTLKQQNGMSFYASDISTEALKIAQKNARLNGVNKEIKFLSGDLLSPILIKLAKLKTNKLIITANLPYLSKEIYNSAPIDVKKFEPKTALYSPKHGLAHYEKLLKQLQELLSLKHKLSATVFLEISPEQKTSLQKIIKKNLPKANVSFEKDLAKKWRLCQIETSTN